MSSMFVFESGARPGREEHGAGHRTNRACDLCHQRRQKCDGRLPCARCEGRFACQYQRPRYKPGGPRRKDNCRTPNTSEKSRKSRRLASQESEISAISQPSPLSDCHINPGRAHQASPASKSQSPTASSTSDASDLTRITLMHSHYATVNGNASTAKVYDTVCATQDSNNKMLTPAHSTSTHEADDHEEWRDFDNCPVLSPLLPYVSSFLSAGQATSLLESYFSSKFQSTIHPRCLYMNAFLFRRQSFMSRTAPRKRSPALLASMLWASLETGGGETLWWPSGKKKSVCQSLSSVVFQFLPTPDLIIAALQGCSDRSCTSDHGYPGTLDDVIAYTHVATILLNKDDGRESICWWQAAFALARELGLNEELSPTSDFVPGPPGTESVVLEYGATPITIGLPSPGSDPFSDSEEETLEMRRRTWWLLYIQDRHLALRFNWQHAILDAECQSLLPPLDEAAWQSGFYIPMARHQSFPSLRCTGLDIYGWLLPLMTIVGTIQDYAITKRHHTLGSELDEDRHMEQHMFSQLDTYAESVSEIERTNDVWDLHFTKVVIAYAEYFIQICRMLLKGPWIPRKGAAKPPRTCTDVVIDAVAAANNLKHILDLDADVSFIPLFLGAQMLHNSLPLLYAVQRLGSKTNTKILEACEIIVRAIDAYNSTMNHDCYKDIRQLLRAAVSRARGRPLSFRDVRYLRCMIPVVYHRVEKDTGIVL